MAQVRPLFASEKLLTPPYKGCGISSAFHLYMLATDNEAGLNKYGRHIGQGGRRAALKRGWAAFVGQPIPDSNGIVDQGDMPAIHRAMFPDHPEPELFNTDDWSKVLLKLKQGYAISIALKLSVLPATSPLRKYTSAPHQVVIYGDNGNGKTRRIDPMHPISDIYSAGEWVPLSDVRKAAFGFGEALTWIAPIGGWTAEAVLRAKKNKQLATVGKALDKAVIERNAAVQALKDCEDECLPCDEQLAAQRDAILDRFAALADDIRQENP